MIEIDNLSKQFGTKVAIAGLSLAVEPGEILGLLGPNGAGKSTTIRVLVGLLSPDSGHVRVAGHDIVQEPLQAKRRLGYVPESPKLYEGLSADSFLDVIGALYHLPSESAAGRREELLRLFGLFDTRYNRVAGYSKGMRQKLVIAAALIHSPEVLILDEPFDGLDPNTIALLKALLSEMALRGKTILFSSHIIDLVQSVATRICIIHEGQKVAEGTAEEIGRELGATTLEEAFGRATGARNVREVVVDALRAIDAGRTS